MILQYETGGDMPGFISQITFDPVPPGLADTLEENGIAFIIVEGEPSPEEPVIDPLTMLPMMVGDEPVVESQGLIYPSVDSNIKYVSDGNLVDRPAMMSVPSSVQLVAGSNTPMTFMVPQGTKVYLDNAEVGVVDDGSLELVSDMVETYTIVLRKWPYRDVTMEVISSAP